MPPRPSFLLVLALILGAVGLALLAVSVGTNNGWVMLGVGVGLVVFSLVVSWIVVAKRDRTLR